MENLLRTKLVECKKEIIRDVILDIYKYIMPDGFIINKFHKYVIDCYLSNKSLLFFHPRQCGFSRLLSVITFVDELYYKSITLTENKTVIKSCYDKCNQYLSEHQDIRVLLKDIKVINDLSSRYDKRCFIIEPCCSITPLEDFISAGDMVIGEMQACYEQNNNVFDKYNCVAVPTFSDLFENHEQFIKYIVHTGQCLEFNIEHIKTELFMIIDNKPNAFTDSIKSENLWKKLFKINNVFRKIYCEIYNAENNTIAKLQPKLYFSSGIKTDDILYLAKKLNYDKECVLRLLSLITNRSDNRMSSILTLDWDILCKTHSVFYEIYSSLLPF